MFSRADLQRAFQLNPARKAAVHELTTPPVVVVDDVYLRPLEVCQLASIFDYGLDLGFTEHKLYPGERSRLSVRIDDVEDAILDHYFTGVGDAKEPTRCSRQEQSVIFTKMNDVSIPLAEPRQRVPHIDSDCELVAVVYLGQSSAAQSSSTAFYSHRKTGLSFLPRCPPLSLVNLAFEDGYDILTADGYRRFVKSLMFSGGGGHDIAREYTGLPYDSDEWKILLEVTGIFNRCAIFPARHFHSPVYRSTSLKGQTGERITQNFFFSIR